MAPGNRRGLFQGESTSLSLLLLCSLLSCFYPFALYSSSGFLRKAKGSMWCWAILWKQCLWALSLLTFSLLSGCPLLALRSRQNLFWLFCKSRCTLLSFLSSIIYLTSPILGPFLVNTYAGGLGRCFSLWLPCCGLSCSDRNPLKQFLSQ